jgi:hypothetical protein
MNNAFLITILTALSVSGCTNWETSSVPTSSVVNSDNTFAAKNVELTTEPFDPSKHQKVVDLSVSVNKTTIFNRDPSVADVEDKLRQEAFRAGATKVVEVRITDVGISLLSYGTRKGFGIAVK